MQKLELDELLLQFTQLFEVPKDFLPRGHMIIGFNWEMKKFVQGTTMVTYPISQADTFGSTTNPNNKYK